MVKAKGFRVQGVECMVRIHDIEPRVKVTGSGLMLSGFRLQG